MSEREEAAALLAAAEKDLRALGGMGDAATFADEVVGFHAQQAVEKVLKAWLAAAGVEFPKTHDLRVLLGALESRGHDVTRFWDLVGLNAFAVRLRYTTYEPLDRPLDRGTTMQAVRALFDHANALVGGAAP